MQFSPAIYLGKTPERKVLLRRREKFLLSSFLLTLCLFGIQYIPLDFRLFGVILFFFVAYAISAWALFEDLNGVEWVTIVPFPGVFAVAMSLFYFLLPGDVWSKGAILGLYGVGTYGLYLTCNIYSVAKLRTIQLFRAAQAVGFFMTLICTLLLSNTVFSQHLSFWMNGLLIAGIVFFLSVQNLWSVELKKGIDVQVYVSAFIAAVVAGALAMLLSFLPVAIWGQSLYVVATLYTTLGLQSAYMMGKLFKNTVWEYFVVWAFMTLAFFLLLQWK